MPVAKLNAQNTTTLPAIGGVRTDDRDTATQSEQIAEPSVAWRRPDR